MRFIIYGAGGIGAALGGYLWEAGFETVLIARGEHLRRIQQDGLTLISGTETRVLRVPAVGHPAEITPTPGDVVALTMKTQDTEAALRDLRDAGADTDHTPIFCVQNCLANERLASRYFAQVYGVMIVIPGIYLEPGVVHNPITGNHGYMEIGRYPGGTDATVEAFVAAMRQAGYAANPHPNVMSPKGAKFLDNLSNALGAITDGRGDEQPYRQHMRQEAMDCLTAAGLPFDPEPVFRAQVKAHRGEDVPLSGVLAQNRGSSWQSLMRRQGSIETDYLNGEVVYLGRRYGIPTPFNRVLQRVAVRMAREGQQPGLYSAEELFEMALAEA